MTPALEPGRSVHLLETELGPARMFYAVPDRVRAVLLLGHGAGGGVDAPDLEALTRLAGDGVAVLRFEQPWRTAGKRVAPAPARLDAGWRAAREYATAHFPGRLLVLGGRSAGARVACRSATGDEPAGDSPAAQLTARVAGVVALAFPLHPPGRPGSSRPLHPPDRPGPSRAYELLAPACPVLVLQGERDPFGTPEEIAATIIDAPRHRLIAVPGCAHEFKPAKRGPLDQASVADLLVAGVAQFIADLRRSGNSAPGSGVVAGDADL